MARYRPRLMGIRMRIFEVLIYFDGGFSVWLDFSRWAKTGTMDDRW